jgi:trans-AT polyketide synthase/acyltransferase/oxidoreductase domain-containing protein
VVSNVTARLYNHEKIVLYLKEQITSSVKWVDSIQYINSLGRCKFTEIGPGDVLTKLSDVILSYHDI